MRARFERTTTFTHDGEGRLLGASVSLSDEDVTGVTRTIVHERQLLRDFWGNVAVDRLRNLDSAGAAPERFGASTGAARAWIETHRHFVGERLVREQVDRRPLNEDESGPVSDATNARFLEYTFDHYPDGTLHHVYLPNGATRTLLVDGFGTLYSSTVANATEELVEVRRFIDAALDVVKVHRGDPTAGPSLWTELVRGAESGVVERIVEPTYDPIGGAFSYGGSLGGAEHVLTRDAGGRVRQVESMDGANVLAHVEIDYDELDRMVQRRVHALDAGSTVDTTTWYYGGATRLERLVRPGGRTWTWTCDELSRPRYIDDSLAPTSNRTELTWWSGSDLVYERITRLVEEDVDGSTTSRSFTTRFDWDALGRLRRVEDRGEGGSQPPETDAFWYYATGDTQWHVRWKGSTRPQLGSNGSREQRFLPDARSRLVEHALLGDGGTTDDIVLDLAWLDWTDANTARTRLEREDGLDHRTITHYDFDGRPDIVQRPGAPSALPQKVPANHTILGTYDAASRLVELVHGAAQASLAPTTELLWNGAGDLIARQFLSVDSFPLHSAMASREVLERDAIGRIARATTYSGDLGAPLEAVSVARDEDSIGRVHDETYSFGWLDHAATDTWSVTSTFDAGLIDRRATLGYESGLTIEHGWDAIGRLDGLKWNPQGSSEVMADYTHFGQRTASRALKPDDVTTDLRIVSEIGHDAYGRTASILDRRFVGGSPSATLASYELVYDGFGNLVEERYDRLDGDPQTQNDGDLFDATDSTGCTRPSSAPWWISRGRCRASSGR
ncbi:MAG: hypothetical protein IPM29_17230 [Planctomycetes bacterium]|nr:hypothetical protein [Planctomycetota bacterium]